MASLDDLLADEPPPAGLDDLLADAPASAPQPAQQAQSVAPSDEAEPWWRRATKMGASDVLAGPGQLMQHLMPDSVMNVARTAASSIAGAVPGLPDEIAQDIARPRSTEDVDRAIGDRERQYQAARKEAGREGFDWWRTAGAVANPLSWLSPSGGGAGIWNAVRQGAKAGAFQSLLQPVAAEGQFLWDKGMQAVIGAGVGGPLGGALALLKPAFTGASNWVKKSIGASDDKAAEAAAEGAAQAALRAAGADPSKMDPNLYSAIRTELADAMKVGVDPDPAVMARRADASSLPVPIHLTRGQATGDPMQFAWEHRVSGQQGVGEPLAELHSAQNRALIENLNLLGAKSAPSTYSASEQIIKHLQDVDKQMRSQVDAAYKLVRNAQGRSATMDREAFIQRAKNELTDGQPELAHLVNRGDRVPEDIRGEFLDLSTGKIPLTVDVAQALDRSWNEVQRGAKPAVAAAIGKLRRALNDTPIADPLGQEAMQAYKSARQMAAQRFGLIDSNPALKAVVDGGAEPDRFFQKYVESADVSKLQGLKQIIGPDNTKMLQDTMMGQIKRRALNKASDERGEFSQAAFNGIMQDPVQAPRIRELFSDAPQTLDHLYRLGRTSELMMRKPSGSRVNYSNTAVEAANIIRDVARSETGKIASSMTPNMLSGLWRAVTDVGEKVKESKRVSEALRPSVTRDPLPQAREPGLGRLSDLAGRAGAAAVAADQRERERE